ncbi:MAG: GHKL domain-containing protein [Agathobacter sp.]|nr:GHKL domain-containing protein [Agathobacter sp.]
MKVLEMSIYLLTIVMIAYGICGLEPRVFQYWQLSIVPVVAIAMIIWTNSTNIGLKGTILYGVIFVIFIMLFDEGIKCTIFFSILITILHALLINVESVVCVTLLEYDSNSLMIPLNILLLCVVLSLWIKKHSQVKLKEIGKGYRIILFLSFVVDVISTLYLGDYILIYYQSNICDALYFEAIYLVIVIGIIFKFFLMVRLVMANQVYRENQVLAERLIEIQREHYEYLCQREKETKSFRHDIKNHMAVIKKLLKDDCKEDLIEYTRAMDEKLESFSNKINVNNNVADAIINQYYKEAEEKGVRIDVEGHFPNPCRVSTYDLSIIISNLLSNALEAELKTDENRIKVEIRYTETEIFFEITNHVSGAPKIRNGIIETTKTDKIYHGYGMNNIRESVAKYKGEYIITSDNTSFRALIILENRELLK